MRTRNNNEIDNNEIDSLVANEAFIFVNALIENDRDTVKILLEKNILNPNDTVEFNGGKYPLIAVALMLSRNEIALDLLALGAKANVRVKNNSGKEMGLLALCYFNIQEKVLSEILKQGVDLNEIVEDDADNASYFKLPIRVWHLFCLKGDEKLVKLIIQEGKNLRLDNSSKQLTILELLQPKKYPVVEKLYKKCLIKLNENFQSIEMQKFYLSLRIYEALKPALIAENNGNPKAISETLEKLGASFNKPEDIIGFINLLKGSENITESEFAKNYVTEFENNLLPIWNLHQGFKALFEGGNQSHQEICRLINMMEQNHSNKTHPNLKQDHQPVPNPTVPTKRFFAPKTEILKSALKFFCSKDKLGTNEVQTQHEKGTKPDVTFVITRPN